MFKSIPAIALVLAGLAGCAQPEAAPQSAVSRTVAYPLNRHDASYKVWGTVVSGQPERCSSQSYGVVVIGDHSITFAYSPDLIFTPLITEAGFFKETQGPNLLQGQITGNKIDATVTTPLCTVHYSGHEIWNHSATAPLAAR